MKHKYKILIFAAIFFLLITYFFVLAKLPEYNFDQSMNCGLSIRFGVHDTPQEEKRWLEFLKELYNKNCFKDSSLDLDNKIPAIFHHVWLGSEIPEAYNRLRQIAMKLHPGAIFKLWTDDDVERFDLKNKYLFELAKNYGKKSDIFRYEIINRYGGTYFDTDVRCLKPLNVLLKSHDFYVGIMNAGEVLLAIGIFGATANHPLLNKIIDSMHDKGSQYNTNDIMESTGPIYFTKVFVKEAADLPGNIIAYPCSFFYPVPNTHRGGEGQKAEKQFIRPETFAVHYWECSWMRKQAFIMDGQEEKPNHGEDYQKNEIESFLDQYFKGQNGVFVDIGAADGKNNNHTFYLEKIKKWQGICVEKNMDKFLQLGANRIAFCANCTLASEPEMHSKHETKRTFTELLDLCRFKKIDYLNLNLKNGSAILKAIDLGSCGHPLISIKGDDQEAEAFLVAQGYKLIDNKSGIKFLQFDENKN